MATKKKARRGRPQGRQRSKSRGRGGISSPGRSVKTDLEALTERLDMMLPELIARVAAAEHLLVEKGICSHEDLVRSRRFIDEQESW